MSQLIHKAILAIQGDIHSVGIGKLRRNKEQNFDFRGIDDALSAFAPLLTEHKVIMSPVYGGITVMKRQTQSGKNTYNVKLHGTFTFTHADDGSIYTVGPVYGEANDGQDKAVSKAESIALRQMFFIAFCVPHEPVIGGDPDAGIAEAEIEFITEAQEIILRDLIDAYITNKPKFMEYVSKGVGYTVEKLCEIPAGKFDVLHARLREIAKEKSGAA